MATVKGKKIAAAKSKGGNGAVATAPAPTEVKEVKPIKNRAEGLKVVASLSVDPNKCQVTDKFRGRSAPVKDDDVIALADSVRSVGQQQPVQIRAIEGTDEYETIFGNTRVRACQLIKNGYTNGDGKVVEAKPDFQVRAELVEVSDEEAFKRNIIENNDRVACSPIDNMKNQERLRTDYQMSDAAIARLYGFSHSVTVHNLKKLQNLAEEYQQMIHNGDMTVTAGLKLVEFPEDVQDKIMKLATGDNDESGIKFGATQIISAIQAYKKAEKEANAPPAPNADGTTSTPTEGSTEGTTDGSVSGGTRDANNVQDKTYALTQKQFKDALTHIAGYEEKNEAGEVVKRCPEKVAELCNMLLSFVAGQTPIEQMTRWMQENVQGPVSA